MIIPFGFMRKVDTGGGSGCIDVTNSTTSILSSGTNSDSNVALSNYYINSHTQQIYTSAEMGGTRQITGIQFYNALSDSIPWTYSEVVIKFAHCTGTSHSTANFVGTFPDQEIVGVTGISDEATVYDGSLSLENTSGWNSIELDTNFCYDGTSNLVISISKKQNGSGNCSAYSSGCGYSFDYARFRYTNDGSGSSTGVWYENDNNVPTGITSSGSSTKGDINNFRAHLRILDYEMPPITSNLQLYINPDSGVYSDASGTVAVDGDNVRQVDDLSGNENTLNQTTASLQPLYKTSILGNGNASFQAQNDALNFTTNITRGTTDDFTIYLVYKRTNTSNTSYILRGTNSSAYPALYFNGTSHLFRSKTGGTAAVLDYTATTDVEIVAYTFDRTAQEVKMYINNSLEDTYSIYFGRQFTDFDRIFANATHIVHYGNALIYYSAHSSTEVGTMSDWLNTKYQTY